MPTFANFFNPLITFNRPPFCREFFRLVFAFFFCGFRRSPLFGSRTAVTKQCQQILQPVINYRKCLNFRGPSCKTANRTPKRATVGKVIDQGSK